MPKISELFLFFLIFCIGVALFFAARDFARGIGAARDEHRIRWARRQKPRRPHRSEGRAEWPHNEEVRHLPWHEVLEVCPSASPSAIKLAYRRMITLYHPDRVEGLGVELRTVAERRAKEINEAYAIARKLREF